MDETPDDTERLVAALRELEPRTARLLELRLLHGKSDEELARFFGMSTESYVVHLLRAARAFMQAYTPVWGSAEREVPIEVEITEGTELSRALTAASHPAPSVAALWRALSHLSAQGPRVRRRLEELAKQEAASPAARRETLIRRVLVVILVVVTLYLYFSRPSF